MDAARVNSANPAANRRLTPRPKSKRNGIFSIGVCSYRDTSFRRPKSRATTSSKKSGGKAKTSSSRVCCCCKESNNQQRGSSTSAPGSLPERNNNNNEADPQQQVLLAAASSRGRSGNYRVNFNVFIFLCYAALTVITYTVADYLLELAWPKGGCGGCSLRYVYRN
uniref:Uncharacterized protein n=1 Tax=Trichogramma kaykai TaxID=54128 RepID=A0ABD2WRA9_9HYME